MPPELRPRQQKPLQDHTYSQSPRVPIYDLRQTSIVSGPGGIFGNEGLSSKAKTPEKPKVKRTPSGEPSKKRKKQYYGEKRKRKRGKRSEKEAVASVTQTNAMDTGESSQSAGTSTTTGSDGDDLKTPSEKCGDDSDPPIDLSCQHSSGTREDTPRDSQTDDGNMPHVWGESHHGVFLSNSSGPGGTKKHKRICDLCGKKWKKKTKVEDEERRYSSRLVKKNYKLPFDQLPDICKLHIFSFLKPQEKGSVALVCSEWANLMKAPSLWSHIDFDVFDPPLQKTRHPSQTRVFTYRWFNTCGEYSHYRQRLFKFVTFLREVRPKIQTLCCHFDIAHPKDEWLRFLLQLLDAAQCHDLTQIDIDWTITPIRPPCADKYCCLFNKVRVRFSQHLLRVRKFHVLLDRFVKLVPNLKNIRMPFDWSEHSVHLLGQLKNLRVLRLGKYLVTKPFQQSAINTLLQSLPGLQELELNICIPVFSNRTLYSISHPRLEVLDIVQCQGFFLKSVKLPCLTVIHVDRKPWRGPLVENRDTNPIPCLYGILRSGAPSLSQVNRHKLQGYWLEFMYEELDSMLEKACPCKDHTLNWNT